MRRNLIAVENKKDTVEKTELERDSFCKRLLTAINEVRMEPRSIVPRLEMQMRQIDDEKVLHVPGRDPV